MWSESVRAGLESGRGSAEREAVAADVPRPSGDGGDEQPGRKEAKGSSWIPKEQRDAAELEGRGSVRPIAQHDYDVEAPLGETRDKALRGSPPIESPVGG